MIRRAGLPSAPAPFECPVELPDDYARISWAELTGYMRRMLLRDADQMSMAVSLELRVPFLDHELVEYILGLPAAAKKRYPGTKGLLVEACRDLLPPSVYQPPESRLRFADESLDARATRFFCGRRASRNDFTPAASAGVRRRNQRGIPARASALDACVEHRRPGPFREALATFSPSG